MVFLGHSNRRDFLHTCALVWLHNSTSWKFNLTNIRGAAGFVKKASHFFGGKTENTALFEHFNGFQKLIAYNWLPGFRCTRSIRHLSPPIRSIIFALAVAFSEFLRPKRIEAKQVRRLETHNIRYASFNEPSERARAFRWTPRIAPNRIARALGLLATLLHWDTNFRVRRGRGPASWFLLGSVDQKFCIAYDEFLFPVSSAMT